MPSFAARSFQWRSLCRVPALSQRFPGTLCRAPALSWLCVSGLGALCRHSLALCVEICVRTDCLCSLALCLGPRALCVGARRSLCRVPALSMSGPAALSLSVSVCRVSALYTHPVARACHPSGPRALSSDPRAASENSIGSGQQRPAELGVRHGSRSVDVSCKKLCRVHAMIRSACGFVEYKTSAAVEHRNEIVELTHVQPRIMLSASALL